MDELSTIMDISNIGIAAVTDTWFGGHIPKSSMEVSGFKGFRHDRVTKTMDGGLMLCEG